MIATGRLAERIVQFVRVLRAAGIPVGPERSVAALEAVQAVGIANRDDFRAALAAVLLSRQEHRAIFDEAFDVFWRNPRSLEKAIVSLLPKVYGRAEPEGEQMSPRIAEALAGPLEKRRAAAEPNEMQFDAAFTFSANEVLRHRDFEAMTGEELEMTRRMLARLRLPLPELPTRRSKPAAGGRAIDLRRTIRRATTAAGALAPLARRERRRRRPSLVVLCDISGSMDRYARMLMHFLHAVTNDRDRVQVFVFGTRLTNVTRQLRHRDVDVALARVGGAASDWSGGTRIGACLAEFNKRWSRRVLAQDAIVLLISDGLDAEAGEGLAAQMERLSKSCRRVVWLNPLLRFEGFEPRPAGVRAMLPYVDVLLPCHSVDSIAALATAFDASRGGRNPNRSRTWR
jgi:uncharacterized protein with von Willebrand factor type A (vWA) domain